MDTTVPEPPKREKNEIEQDLKRFKKERVDLLTTMYGKLAELYSIERDLIIYRLVKGGFISTYKMADLSEMTPTTIYKIVQRIENGDYK